MVICLQLGADLYMAQLIALALTVSCFSKIQIGITFLVPAHPGSPGKRAINGCVCVCVCVCVLALWSVAGTVNGFDAACVRITAKLVNLQCVFINAFLVDFSVTNCGKFIVSKQI